MSIWDVMRRCLDIFEVLDSFVSIWEVVSEEFFIVFMIENFSEVLFIIRKRVEVKNFDNE